MAVYIGNAAITLRRGWCRRPHHPADIADAVAAAYSCCATHITAALAAAYLRHATRVTGAIAATYVHHAAHIFAYHAFKHSGMGAVGGHAALHAPVVCRGEGVL